MRLLGHWKCEVPENGLLVLSTVSWLSAREIIARPFARIDKLGLKSHQIRRRTKSCSQECNTIDTAGPNVWCWLSQSSPSCVSGQMAKKQSHPSKVNHSVELTASLPLSLTHLFSTLHDGNFCWSADRWQKLLFCPRTSVFCPAYWSPATSCRPAFVCVSVHVSLPLLLFALLHVIAVPDSAVGPDSLTVQVIKKEAFPHFEKSVCLNPEYDQMSVLLVIPNDHLWKGRLTQKWQNLHSIVSPAGSMKNGCKKGNGC